MKRMIPAAAASAADEPIKSIGVIVVGDEPVDLCPLAQ